MPQHLVAFTRSTATAANTFEAMNCVADAVLAQASATAFSVKPGMRIVGGYVGSNSAAPSLAGARINSPTFRRIGLPNSRPMSLLRAPGDDPNIQISGGVKSTPAGLEVTAIEHVKFSMGLLHEAGLNVSGQIDVKSTTSLAIDALEACYALHGLPLAGWPAPVRPTCGVARLDYGIPGPKGEVLSAYPAPHIVAGGPYLAYLGSNAALTTVIQGFKLLTKQEADTIALAAYFGADACLATLHLGVCLAQPMPEVVAELRTWLLDQPVSAGRDAFLAATDALAKALIKRWQAHSTATSSPTVLQRAGVPAWRVTPDAVIEANIPWLVAEVHSKTLIDLGAAAVAQSWSDLEAAAGGAGTEFSRAALDEQKWTELVRRMNKRMGGRGQP